MSPKRTDRLTHDELVSRAYRWLRARGCKVICWRRNTNCHEQPDALGFRRCGWSWLIECKVSRADFFADRDKPHRVLGVGSYRYYLTPPDLIGATEVPDGWGLLEVRGRSVMEVVPARFRSCDRNLFEELKHAIRQAWLPDGKPGDVRGPVTTPETLP